MSRTRTPRPEETALSRFLRRHAMRPVVAALCALAPWAARTSTPVLLLSTRYDPATPHRNAVRVHDLLLNSALLNVDGVGHGALPFSSCAQLATAQYLLTGAVPVLGTVCPQDLAPFDQPPA